MWKRGLFRCSLALVAFAGSLHSQIITTLVGTDWSFPTGTLAAAKAPLGQVQGVAVDGAGNVFVADCSNNLVLRISLNGVIDVVAGNGISGFSGDGGPATSASLNDPAAVAVDSAGSIYIADEYNFRIRKVSGGTITTVAGSGYYGFFGDGGPATSASLAYPSGVAIDSAGDLYIADTVNSRIRKVSNGTITTVAGGGSPPRRVRGWRTRHERVAWRPRRGGRGFGWQPLHRRYRQ